MARGSCRVVVGAFSPGRPRRGRPQRTAMPTKAPADSAQQKRKSGVIDDITNRLKTADASVLTEYRGLTVTDLAALRAALRPAATDYKVYKNTLARRAAKDAGLRRDGRPARGPGRDRVRTARGRRGHRGQGAQGVRQDQPEPRGEGRDARAERPEVADLDALAEVPPREVLLAKLAGGFQAPMVKAAGLFSGLHPQLRLRPEGVHRHKPPPRSRRPEPDPGRGRGSGRRTRRRIRP